MLQLPENRILKSIIYASTVAVVICYAWLTAKLLEPSFEVPSNVVASVFFREKNDILFFDDVYRDWPTEAAMLASSVSAMNEKFELLGHLPTPLRLVIDSEHSDRLVVTNDRIEIGTAVLRARGQLKKAILKSWLLQRVSSEVASSFLRIEVASDVLLAILEGGLVLGVPGSDEIFEFDKPMNAWWTFADSYQGVCRTLWRSLELARLCGADKSEAPAQVISALSFRAFLGNQIWKSYVATSAGKRERFTREWLAALTAAPTSLGTLSGSTTSIDDARTEVTSQAWLPRLQEEMEVLLPSAMDPLASERLAWPEELDAPLVVIDESGAVTAPGSLKVAASEIKVKKAKLALLTRCSIPFLKDLIDLPVKADRVVWQPECEERSKDFVQVRPSSVQLAISRGLGYPYERLDEFIRKHGAEPLDQQTAQKPDWLGLKKPVWNEEQKAFRVKGAIEAIEWYRLSGS